MDFKTEIKCYVCNGIIVHKGLEMILWNRKTKPVCSGCYKTIEEGIKVYQENNPDWQRPTAN